MNNFLSNYKANKKSVRVQSKNYAGDEWMFWKWTERILKLSKRVFLQEDGI